MKSNLSYHRDEIKNLGDIVQATMHTAKYYSKMPKTEKSFFVCLFIYIYIELNKT